MSTAAQTQPATQPAPSNAAPVTAAPLNVATQPATQPAVQEQSASQQVQTQQPTGFGGQQHEQQATGFGGQAHEQQSAPPQTDPNSYTPFRLPESADPNDAAVIEMMGHFKAAAGRRGMTQEQAQAALDLMTELDGHAEAHGRKGHEATVSEWTSQSQQLGLMSQDSLSAANRGLKTLELNEKGPLHKVLNDTGLIYHPAMIQVFAAFARTGGRPAALVNMGGAGAGGRQRDARAGPVPERWGRVTVQGLDQQDWPCVRVRGE